MAAARIQRWALILAGYEYEILYKKGKKNGNADCLSRLPLKESVDLPLPGESILLIEHLNSTPVYAENCRMDIVGPTPGSSDILYRMDGK